MDDFMERKCDKDSRKVLHKKGKSLFVQVIWKKTFWEFLCKGDNA